MGCLNAATNLIEKPHKQVRSPQLQTKISFSQLDKIQSFAGYLSIEMGIGKDLVCSCGLLNRLCSAFIRFGVVVT